MKLEKPEGRIGRPREFDREQSLDHALRVFREKGYEGTSLADLTEAMGINRPSLYATFGNKEELFRKVLDRYAEGPAAYACQALQAPTARAVAEALLYGAANVQTTANDPPGCLLVQGALACSGDANPIRQELACRRNAGQEALRERFERAKREGDLPLDTDCATLARYIMTVTQGMSVQVVSGATHEELQRIAELALLAFPPKPIGEGNVALSESG